MGPEALHRRLAELDPASAAQILPGNGRRVVRALEVIALTGDPFTAALPPQHYALPGVVQVGLGIDRPRLDQRIAERVDRMWAAGLVGGGPAAGRRRAARRASRPPGPWATARCWPTSTAR